MMTARQYAQKYPGQEVKLSAQGQKEYGLDGQTLGVVVGFKAGTKGVIGSSKVAIHRGKYEKIYGLDSYTNKNYNAVVMNAPDHKLGIYLLSVNYLDLVAPPKPVTTYPHRCGKCGSPARKGSNIIVCSNSRCKSNRLVLVAIGPIPKFYTTDKDKYVLCPTCQIQDNVVTKDLDFNSKYGDHKHIICLRKNHLFNHSWKEGQKMLHKGIQHYIWKAGQLAQLQVKVAKK